MSLCRDNNKTSYLINDIFQIHMYVYLALIYKDKTYKYMLLWSEDKATQCLLKKDVL